MKLLQYKSTEMFSSTELIRKSKTIFNKIIDEEIDKAIILRDGKPSFLLMDFKKYERIMAEYEELKEYHLNKKNKKKAKKPKKPKKIKIEAKPKAVEEKPKILIKPTVKPTIKVKPKVKAEPTLDMKPTFPLPVRTTNKYTNKATINQKINKPIVKITKIETKAEDEELSEEQELNVAMKSLDSINLDDDMKKIAETKIKNRILKARKDRQMQKEEALKIQKEQDLQEQMIFEKAQASKEQKE